MGRHTMLICTCGSGQLSTWQYDARGIPLCRTCPVCHQKKMGRYRRDVLTNPNYHADEPIDPE
jgi:hypothetical protein